jgi:DNA-binding response OmpR family regulator
MKELARSKAKGTIILVIVYEYVIRNVLARMLMAKGHTVVTCSVGFDGIRKFEKGKGKFDLVIIDIPLPGIGSLSVAKKIKKISQKTPVILIKGWDKELDTKEVKDSGIDLIISKPLYIDKTLNLVNGFMQL